MEITKLIEFVEANSNWEFRRGEIIDYIAYDTDDWIMTLKALLIKNPAKYISKTYLLEKLDFMRNHPETPYLFLDYDGTSIFTILRQL